MSTAKLLTFNISSLILQICFGWCDNCLLLSAETGIFGVPLTTLLENDQKKFPGSKVPLVFKKVCSLSLRLGLVFAGLWCRGLNHSNASFGLSQSGNFHTEIFCTGHSGKSLISASSG